MCICLDMFEYVWICGIFVTANYDRLANCHRGNGLESCADLCNAPSTSSHIRRCRQWQPNSEITWILSMCRWHLRTRTDNSIFNFRNVTTKNELFYSSLAAANGEERWIDENTSNSKTNRRPTDIEQLIFVSRIVSLLPSTHFNFLFRSVSDGLSFSFRFLIKILNCARARVQRFFSSLFSLFYQCRFVPFYRWCTHDAPEHIGTNTHTSSPELEHDRTQQWLMCVCVCVMHTTVLCSIVFYRWLNLFRFVVAINNNVSLCTVNDKRRLQSHNSFAASNSFPLFYLFCHKSLCVCNCEMATEWMDARRWYERKHQIERSTLINF